MDKRICVLCYHRVIELDNDYNMLAVNPVNFRNQMLFLKKNYNIIKLQEIDKYNDEKLAFCITFDDGYMDLYSIALPILKELDIPATMFISTQNIGLESENWTDKILNALINPKTYYPELILEDEFAHLRFVTNTMENRFETYSSIRYLFNHISVEKRTYYLDQIIKWAGYEDVNRSDRRLLSVEELVKLANEPLIEIGAHTVNHSSLKWLSLDEQRKEIVESKVFLEEIIKKEVISFAYPFGTEDDYSNDTINILTENGFKFAVTTRQKLYDKSISILEIPRIGIRNLNSDRFIDFIDNLDSDNNSFNKHISKKVAITYIGKLDKDINLLNKKSNVLIWGCGKRGRKLNKILKDKGLENQIVAYGDNNSSFYDTYVDGIEVVDIEKAKKIQKERNCIVIVSGRFDWEIVVDLVNNGIYEIHLIRGM